MRLRAVFTGFSAARVAQVIDSVREASPVRFDATTLGEDASLWDLDTSQWDVVFVNLEAAPKVLARTLERLRESDESLPVVLTYGREPSGRAFQLACRYRCWLFSEADRLRRALTPSDLGDMLRQWSSTKEAASKLMEISLSTGPCSTGR